MTPRACNVLLVVPKFLESFWNFQESCHIVGAGYPAPPLGLMTVAAMLPRHWECRLVDLNIKPLTDPDLAWADMVMTGGMITQRPSCLDLIARVQQAGKVIVLGGPDPTGSPETYVQADFIVAGEAEAIIDRFVEAWEVGQRRGRFTAEKFKADVTKTPVPRFDLIQPRDYLYMDLQFSRGCPFTCEFCDIIELYGRVPRIKTIEQMLHELDALYNAGYRGHVDFVDDNFIGNKRAVKAFLPHLIAWQRAHDYPFELATEASANLADDSELLAMMREANFYSVFIGIESPDTDTLISMRKKQNTRRSLSDSVHRIYRAGMMVTAGFVVGFDSEKNSIADGMVACIKDTSIPICLVGLLYALPQTQLTKRLQGENRVFPDSWVTESYNAGRTDQCTAGLNFETLRPRRDVLADYRTVIDRAYAPSAFFARIQHLVRELNRFEPPTAQLGHGWRIGGILVREILLLLAYVGMKHPRLFPSFVRTILLAIATRPANLKVALILSVLYLHVGPFSRRVSASIGQQIDAIDGGHWRSPLRRQQASPTVALRGADQVASATHDGVGMRQTGCSGVSRNAAEAGL